MRPFDLIFTWRELTWNPFSWISKAISAITGGGPSHVRLYIGNLIFWEVTFPKPRFGTMAEITGKVEIGRHKKLPFPVPADLVEKALNEMIRLNEESTYDIGELLFSHLFDEIGLDSSDQSLPDGYVCSSGVERIFTLIGYPFRVDDRLVSPQDIRESEFYERVG